MNGNLWDGIWGSVLAAVVSALVAIFVVRLTQHHERRLVLEQRRLEAFAALLSEWHEAWSVTQRGWKDYPEEEHDGVIDTDSVQSQQASALNDAARRTRGAWQVWRLFLEQPSSIEDAAERAQTVLFMEWSYNGSSQMRV